MHHGTFHMSLTRYGESEENTQGPGASPTGSLPPPGLQSQSLPSTPLLLHIGHHATDSARLHSEAAHRPGRHHGRQLDARLPCPRPAPARAIPPDHSVGHGQRSAASGRDADDNHHHHHHHHHGHILLLLLLLLFLLSSSYLVSRKRTSTQLAHDSPSAGTTPSPPIAEKSADT
jgi:hypothetical protein